MSTLELTAHDAGFAMLVDDTQYKTLATHDEKPFSYFLNPSVYGTGTAFIRWDEANKTWVKESEPTLQHLDDRYGVGADYLSDLYGRPPFGSNLPGVFVKLDGDQLVETDVSNLRLTRAYTTAKIVPYLVIKVYEQRLASYDYYTWLGAPLGDGTEGTIDVDDADFGGQGATILELDKETLLETLALQFETALQSGGELFELYKEFTGLELRTDYDSEERRLTVRNMARFDGHEVRGERAGEITTGHMMQPNIVLPGLTRVVGHEYYGYKPMRGVYTVFAPEKLNDLAKVVESTIDALASVTPDQKAALKDALGYRWNDFFRGQDQEIVVRGLDGEAKTIRANVFLAAFGSQLVGATVEIWDEAQGEFVEAAASQGINLADSYSHVDETFHTAKPTAQRFITGPYGAQGIVNDDGTITWLSDGYSV